MSHLEMCSLYVVMDIFCMRRVLVINRLMRTIGNRCIIKKDLTGFHVAFPCAERAQRNNLSGLFCW